MQFMYSYTAMDANKNVADALPYTSDVELE